jgi:hypothetical protein
MSNEIIHKDLYQQIQKVNEKDWLKASEILGLRICRGGKHPTTIRDPKLPDDTGKASLIAVIPNDLHKIMNQKIFKEFLNYGIEEETLWKAIGMLK